MYNMGTVAQEYAILKHITIELLVDAVNVHLQDDWRIHGDLKIEQVINGSVASTSTTQDYSGYNGQNSLSYSLPISGTSGFISSQTYFIQVMIR